MAMDLNEFFELVNTGKENLENDIKLIMYKKHSTLFDEIDFEDSDFFLNPIIFDSISENNFDFEFIINCYNHQLEKLNNISLQTDVNGFIYCPYLGYFQTTHYNQEVKLSFKNDAFELSLENKLIDFKLYQIERIDDKFELFFGPILNLEKYFYSFGKSKVEVEVFEITKIQKENLIKALEIIKNTNHSWYELMKNVTQSFMIFSDKSIQRNSFSALGVHGCAFFNSFQDNYNEVFFIEDIAHQCGHIIFNSFINSKTNCFLIDELTVIKTIYNHGEGRSILVILHAMYTYYSILDCFERCHSNGVFNGHKQHELIGRLHFTISKFYSDYSILINSKGQSEYLNQNGMDLIAMFKIKFDLICENLRETLKDLNTSNQPYNFSYEVFLETNPIKCELNA